MKMSTKTPFACLAAVLAVLATAATARGQLDRSNQIEAVVNDKVITRHDVLAEFAEEGVDLSKLSESDQELEFRRRLHDMVFRILQRSAAGKAGIALSEEDLENSINRVKESKGGEQAFTEFLEDKGLSEKAYLEDFRRQQEAQAWLRVVAGSGGGVKRLSRDLRPQFDLSVTPKEMRAFYVSQKDKLFTFKDERKIRAIQKFFSRGPRGKQRTKAEMQSIRLALDTKADFATLAARESDHQTKDQGGDFGWIEKSSDVLPESIVEAVFAPEAAAGDVLGPFEHVTSYWLVQVEEVREARTVPFEEAQGEIRTRLQGLKWRAAITRVLRDLVEESYLRPVRLKGELIAMLNQRPN